MKQLKITTYIKQYESLNELLEADKQLIIEAREIAKKSYSPYSNFKVGAAILLDNGKVVTGNNQENAAYPSGLCAERTAIFWANAQYPDIPVRKIAISAIKNGETVSKPISPCGSCRQVMIETETRFNTNIETILDSNGEIWVTASARDLMPMFFDSKDLK